MICLQGLPSQLSPDHALHDDLAWMHQHFGAEAQYAAPFLAWHRHFIYIYEQILYCPCGYDGQLAYWEWMLGWENITRSPIWDDTLGFGGNDNMSVGPISCNAHCVTDGPFGGLEVLYL